MVKLAVAAVMAVTEYAPVVALTVAVQLVCASAANAADVVTSVVPENTLNVPVAAA